MIIEQVWKGLHTSAHHTYSDLVYNYLYIIGLYNLYKLYTCLKGKGNCVKSVTDPTESRNVVYIKNHNISEVLSMAKCASTCIELSDT